MARCLDKHIRIEAALRVFLDEISMEMTDCEHSRGPWSGGGPHPSRCWPLTESFTLRRRGNPPSDSSCNINNSFSGSSGCSLHNCVIQLPKTNQFPKINLPISAYTAPPAPHLQVRFLWGARPALGTGGAMEAAWRACASHGLCCSPASRENHSP